MFAGLFLNKQIVAYMSVSLMIDYAFNRLIIIKVYHFISCVELH